MVKRFAAFRSKNHCRIPADRGLVEDTLFDPLADEPADNTGLDSFGTSEVDEIFGLPLLAIGSVELAEAVVSVHGIVADEAKMRLSGATPCASELGCPHNLGAAHSAGRAAYVSPDPSALSLREVILTRFRRVLQHQAGELADIKFASEVVRKGGGWHQE